MLAEFFAGDVDGGVAAAMGGQSMAEALGASLGQVGCRTLCCDWTPIRPESQESAPNSNTSALFVVCLAVSFRR